MSYDQSHFRRGKRPFLALTLGLILLLFGAVAAIAAQEPVDELDGPPPRVVKRTAPARQPIILAQNTLPGGAIQTIIEIPADADAYIASERPNQNFGSSALFLGYNLAGDNYGAERILLHFDVDGAVPDNAIINSADVQLHLSFASPTNDTPMGTELRRLASPWTEGGVTWNTEPTWAEVRASSSVGTAMIAYEWAVTDLVRDWKQDVVDNEGVEIIGDEAVQQRERVFYSRETPTDNYPRLVVDYTISNDTEPPIVTVDPLPAYSPRNFPVSWSGFDQGSAGIDYYDVQYRIDGGAWTDWLTGVTITHTEFTNGENGRLYQFRARGVDEVGNVEPFGPSEAETTVDAAPPNVAVDPLPTITNTPSFTVNWSGDDNGSGIAYYDVRYRIDDGPWVLWQQTTIGTSALFTAGGDGLYQFEARGVDNLGHIEPFTGQPEATTIVDTGPPFVVPQAYMPIIR